MISEDKLQQVVLGLVAFCVRNNTSLEDLHAQKLPIDNDRMKILMIECVDNLYYWINALQDRTRRKAAIRDLSNYAGLYAKEWNSPKEPGWLIELKKLQDEYSSKN